MRGPKKHSKIKKETSRQGQEKKKGMKFGLHHPSGKIIASITDRIDQECHSEMKKQNHESSSRRCEQNAIAFGTIERIAMKRKQIPLLLRSIIRVD
jgi:hypothetical protein